MNGRLILLPARELGAMRLVRAPEDFSERDAVRRLTALIGSVQESDRGYSWEELAAVLEDNGFIPVDFAIGPALD